jgi:hypothetical protein
VSVPISLVSPAPFIPSEASSSRVILLHHNTPTDVEKSQYALAHNRVNNLFIIPFELHLMKYEHSWNRESTFILKHRRLQSSLGRPIIRTHHHSNIVCQQGCYLANWSFVKQQLRSIVSKFSLLLKSKASGDIWATLYSEGYQATNRSYSSTRTATAASFRPNFVLVSQLDDAPMIYWNAFREEISFVRSLEDMGMGDFHLFPRTITKIA